MKTFQPLNQWLAGVKKKEVA